MRTIVRILFVVLITQQLSPVDAQSQPSALTWPVGGAGGSIKVIFDTDFSIPPQDDGLALALAVRSPELQILGVTTVAGNDTRAARLRPMRFASLKSPAAAIFPFMWGPTVRLFMKKPIGTRRCTESGGPMKRRQCPREDSQRHRRKRKAPSISLSER